jgi:hypothetical protein
MAPRGSKPRWCLCPFISLSRCASLHGGPNSFDGAPPVRVHRASLITWGDARIPPPLGRGTVASGPFLSTFVLQSGMQWDRVAAGRALRGECSRSWTGPPTHVGG